MTHNLINFDYILIIINIVSMMALAITLRIFDKWEKLTIYDRLIQNLLQADFLVTFSFILENVINIIFIIYFENNGNNCLLLLYVLEVVLFFGNLFMYLSFSFALGISYVVYKEYSIPETFNLNQDIYNSIRQKGIVISFIFSVIISICDGYNILFKFVQAELLLFTCIFLFLILQYYVRTIRYILKENLIRLNQIKYLLIFPFIVFFCFGTVQILYMIVSDTHNILYCISILLTQFYGLFDSLAYGWITYQNYKQSIEFYEQQDLEDYEIMNYQSPEMSDEEKFV